MKMLLRAAAKDFRRCWRTLFVTDVVYKIMAFVLLTPLVAILFRVIIGLSGNTVLADQDVLFFLLGPIGFTGMTLVGALWLGIVAVEQAALIAIVATPADQKMSVVSSLRFGSAHAWQVSQVTARLILRTALVIAPFAAIAAIVYSVLLTEFDINFYLKEKPREFQVAVSIGVVLMIGLTILLLRIFSGWFFALPLVLFEGVPGKDALQKSRERAIGQRRKLLLLIVTWGLATLLLSTLASSLVIAVGRFLVPKASGSLSLLVVAIGICLLLWAIANLLTTLIGTTSFAALLFNAYRSLGCDGKVDLSKLEVADSFEAAKRFQISKKRLLTASLGGIVFATIAGIVAVRSVRLNDDVAIVAHRGASESAPENSLAAVRQAIKDQADWVEIDVQETIDGEVVVLHDSDFMKLAGVNLKIWDAKIDDLKNIDIGSSFAPEFSEERVPTLDQVLATCKGKVGVIIELKYYGHDQSLEQRVIDIVESHDMGSAVMFMSLKLDAVKKMKAMRPEWKTGLLMSVVAGKLSSIEADFLAVNASFVNRAFVHEAHSGNKEVFAWTVNDPVSMSTMVGRGVDGLITDNPALANEVLKQRAFLSPAERLIIELAETLGVPTAIVEQ